MIYLLDANVLIDANRDYYPIDRVREFWGWLVHQGMTGSVKIPLEIYEEIKEGKDQLAQWTRNPVRKKALLLEEAADPVRVSDTIKRGYAPDLTEGDIEKLGKDPFLISYAQFNRDGHTIVTTEVSRPSRKGANRHIPDVCTTLGIRWCNTFKFIRDLNFSTDWK